MATRVSAVINSVAFRLEYPELKPFQESAVKSFVSGKDVFVSLPTGYGKSFCYSCLPWVFDALNHKQTPYSMVVVVSPLIALMKDQLKVLTDKGIAAAQIQKKFDIEDDDVKARLSSGHVPLC